MKKNLIYLLLSFVCVLSSCSSDSDDDDTTPYAVEFNVTGFPADMSSPIIYQYVIYKEDGTVLENKAEVGESPALGILEIQKELIPGKYTFAIAFARKFLMTQGHLWVSSNLSTDYCTGNMLIMGNGNIDNIYFESFAFEVSKTSDKVIGTKLQNMGKLLSEIEVEITNYDSYIYPNPVGADNSTFIGYRIHASHSGFSIENKNPADQSREMTSWSDNMGTFTAIDQLKKDKGVWKLPAICGADNVKIELIFQEVGSSAGGNHLKSELIFEGKINTGKKVKLTGKLGESTQFEKTEQDR